MSNIELFESQIKNGREKGDKKLVIHAKYNLGIEYFEMHDFDKSKIFLLDVYNSDPEFKHVNYYLSILNIKEGNNNLAFELLNKEVKLNPKFRIAKKLKEKLTIHLNFPYLTILIFLLNLIMFFYLNFNASYLELVKFSLHNNTLSVSQAFLSLFIHANPIHFFANMFALLMIGFFLEKNIGSFKFLLIYVISGIIGSIIQIFALPDSFVLGASTSIFGIIGATVMRSPLFNLRLFGFIKVPIILIFGFFFIFENVFLTIFNSSYYVTGSVAHLIGFFVGIFLIGLMYNETIEIFYNWLFISLGFLLIFYAGTLIKEMIFNLFIFENLLFSLLCIVIGSFLIFYSYEKLKIKVLEVEE